MADKSLRRGRERQTVGTKALHRGRKRQTVGTKALRRLRERCGSNFILGGGIEVAWPGLLRCEVEREGVAPKSLRQGRERSSVFDSLGACFSSLNTREKRRSSKSSSPRTREKRLGLKICTREVEREAAIAQLCIYEMKQMAVWPDLAWGSREREAVCALDFQTKTTDKQGCSLKTLLDFDTCAAWMIHVIVMHEPETVISDAKINSEDVIMLRYQNQQRESTVDPA